jgi:hypothetical protein
MLHAFGTDIKLTTSKTYIGDFTMSILFRTSLARFSHVTAASEVACFVLNVWLCD